MDAEFHFAVAEIAIALAGFTGLVAGLSGQERSGGAHDYHGLLNILISSGCALVFALLPTALVDAGMDVDSAMQISGLVLGVLMVGIIGFYTALARRVRPRHPWTFWSLLVVGLLISCGLVLGSAGVLDIRFYSPQLLWLLAVGFAQFFSFLMLRWGRPRET